MPYMNRGYLATGAYQQYPDYSTRTQTPHMACFDIEKLASRKPAEEMCEYNRLNLEEKAKYIPKVQGR